MTRLHRKYTGFTLIELMVTIVILTVVIGIVYGSFRSVTDGTDRVRVSAEELRLRQFLSKNLVENFSMAFAPPIEDLAELIDAELVQQTEQFFDPEDAEEFDYFVGEDDDGLDGGRDTVVFWTGAPLSGGIAIPGDRKIVEYTVVSTSDSEAATFAAEIPDEDAPEYYLEASELAVLQGSDLLDEEAEEGDAHDVEFDGPSWRVPVRSVDFEYYDGREWRDEWQYTDEQRLPWAVKVRINFAKTQARIEEEDRAGFDLEEDPDFEVVIPIPAGMGTADAELTDLGASDSRNQRGRQSARPAPNFLNRQ